MPAYVSRELSVFVHDGIDSLVGELNTAYATDSFAQQYVSQTKAWRASLPLLQEQFGELMARVPSASQWRLLLELPLYRLRKRVDAVILTDHYVVVVELKVGESDFNASDRRQVEEYALDLRDFHAASAEARIVPCLWCTEAQAPERLEHLPSEGEVSRVQGLGRSDLTSFLVRLGEMHPPGAILARETWHQLPIDRSLA